MKKLRKPHTAFGQVIAQLAQRYFDHDVGRDSAALTYYLLFALFPLLIFVSALLGLLHLDVASTIAWLGQVVPAQVVGTLENYLTYVTDHPSRQLLAFSAVFSIWFPMRATSALLHSMRKAFGRDKPRSMLANQLRNFLFSIGLMVTITLVTLLTVVGGRALEWISRLVVLPDTFIEAWGYRRFLILGFLMAFAVGSLYMLAQGERRPVREVLPGVLSSLAAWMGLSIFFSYYVEHRAHYSELYGSIAAIVVMLLWLYISGTVLIMGAELSAVLTERREAKAPNDRENTVKEEHPL